MMIVNGDKNYEAGAPPKPELMAAIGKLPEEMIKAGVLLDMGGLLPSSKGARIHVKQGQAHGHRWSIQAGQGADWRYAILQVTWPAPGSARDGLHTIVLNAAQTD